MLASPASVGVRPPAGALLAERPGEAQVLPDVPPRGAPPEGPLKGAHRLAGVLVGPHKGALLYLRPRLLGCLPLLVEVVAEAGPVVIPLVR